MQKLRLYNTASRSVEDFTPLDPREVTMYNCGPTVYNYAHIGNLRSYIFADVLRRTLELAGYAVKQIINITDVGHLVGDGDDGEDKMTAALRREGKPLSIEAMREIGDVYTSAFVNDLHALNIELPFGMPKASDHIPEDIALVSLLLEKGHAYKTSDGIYFDTATFPRYADLARLDLAGMRSGMRVSVGEKKDPTDFALWKFNSDLGYDAPFGRGFPGWHIECSAMIKKHLGHPIDIHTGGVDHIPVHHTNEIAQSESAFGSPFVKYWLHSAHMTVAGEKMSKSIGNIYTLADLSQRNISPLGFRYWVLTASYRTQINVTWEALLGAEKAYDRLRQRLFHIAEAVPGSGQSIIAPGSPENALFNDLDTATAIGTLHEIVASPDIQPEEKLAAARTLDRVLGLRLLEWSPTEFTVPDEITAIAARRVEARENKDWTESDRLREELRVRGWDVTDTPDGPVLKPLAP